jgi:hypothetical protein
MSHSTLDFSFAIIHYLTFFNFKWSSRNRNQRFSGTSLLTFGILIWCRNLKALRGKSNEEKVNWALICLQNGNGSSFNRGKNILRPM